MTSRLKLPDKKITVSLHQVPIFCCVMIIPSHLKPPEKIITVSLYYVTIYF